MIAQWVLPVLLLQMTILLANLWHWSRRRIRVHTFTDETPLRVSVLIPLRNERERLPDLVETLRAQQPAPFEIILCDDSSDDGTREWLEEKMSMYDDTITWFPAPPKPPEWVGKNWACYHLAQRAGGDWLLFLDADIVLDRRGVASLASAIRRLTQHVERVYLVTAIPTLQSPNLLVALLKGMVPFSVFTLLPLRFAEEHPHRSFAFANGQMIAFPREYYNRAQPHKRVRCAILEDVAFARLVKDEGGRVRILDGRRVARVVMYRHLREAVDGFSKNGVAICGSTGAAAAVGLALAIVYLLPLAHAGIAGPTLWHAIDIGLSMALFAISGWMAGLPLWIGILYPLSIVIGEWTLWRSIRWYTRGEVRWKGRTYPVS